MVCPTPCESTLYCKMWTAPLLAMIAQSSSDDEQPAHTCSTIYSNARSATQLITEPVNSQIFEPCSGYLVSSNLFTLDSVQRVIYWCLVFFFFLDYIYTKHVM
jgi:hypothetical protein